MYTEIQGCKGQTVSVLLLVVVYHPPRKGSDENKILVEHIQNNADSLLCKHPCCGVCRF